MSLALLAQPAIWLILALLAMSASVALVAQAALAMGKASSIGILLFFLSSMASIVIQARWPDAIARCFP